MNTDKISKRQLTISQFQSLKIRQLLPLYHVELFDWRIFRLLRLRSDRTRSDSSCCLPVNNWCHAGRCGGGHLRRCGAASLLVPVPAVGLESLRAVAGHPALGAAHGRVKLLVVNGLVVLRAKLLVAEAAGELGGRHGVVLLHVLGQALLALDGDPAGGAVFLAWKRGFQRHKCLVAAYVRGPNIKNAFYFLKKQQM